MNNNYQQQVFLIDIKDYLWRLLAQWKAVVLISLIMALLMCGAKHMKDVRAHNAEIAARNEAARQATLSVEERIAKVMESIPDEEKVMVNYIVSEQEWINEQKAYLHEATLMHTDPTNQRVLKLVFDIEADNKDDLDAIVNSYYLYLNSEDVAEAIKPYIEPDAENKYISELFYREEEELGKATSSDNENALAVNIVLTEGSDAELVSSSIIGLLSDYAVKMKTKHPHALTLVNEDVVHIYHKDNVDYRMNMFKNVNDLENSIKNTQSSLSERQRAAITSIISIKKEAAAIKDAEANALSEEAETNGESYNPGWSTKHALLGFVFGTFIYACLYLVLIVIKGFVCSAANVKNYTQSRLFGELYYDAETNGFAKLFHSKTIEKWRYREKGNVEKQIEKALASIEAISEHFRIKELSLFNMTDTSDSGKSTEILNTISTKAASKNLDVSIVNMNNTMDEKELLNLEKAIFAISSKTKLSEIDIIKSLCMDYDIKNLGSIYVAEK